jgi:hypothetical protein
MAFRELLVESCAILGDPKGYVGGPAQEGQGDVRRLRDRLHGHQAADVLLRAVQHGGIPEAEAGGGRVGDPVQPP